MDEAQQITTNHIEHHENEETIQDEAKTAETKVPPTGDSDQSQTNNQDPMVVRLCEMKKVASKENGDCGSSPSEIPEWFDRELFEKGKLVGQKHFSSVFFGHLSGLCMVVHIPSILTPLLSTGKSQTMADVFLRYLGTLSHVKSWYEGDVWDQNDPAGRSIASVRKMHQQVASKLNTDKTPGTDVVYLSQYDMFLTQFGFIGMIILHPKDCGFPEHEDDLRALIFFWRCIGYLLGIDDRYNLCDHKDIVGTRSICQAVLEKEFKPAISQLSSNQSKEMSQAIVQAIKVILPVLSVRGFTKYMYKMNLIDCPVQLDGVSKVGYQGIKVIMRHCLPRAMVTPAINGLLRRSIQKAQRKQETIKERLANKDSTIVTEETCFTDI